MNLVELVIANVEADNLILKTGNRNEGMQRVVGRKDRLPDDDGGHLIGTQFNGPGDIDNLVAQNKQINSSGREWYEMEKVWADVLKGEPPKTVSVKINPIYSGKSRRPSKFKVIYKIEGERSVIKRIKNQVGGLQMEKEMQSIYQEIADTVNQMIPEEWEKFYFYAQISDTGGAHIFFTIRQRT